MVKLLIVIDGKGRRFFLLKRAEADKFAAATLQFHLARNHIRHRDTVLNLFKEILWKRHGDSLRINGGNGYARLSGRRDLLCIGEGKNG